jgi:hypothetical protein
MRAKSCREQAQQKLASQSTYSITSPAVAMSEHGTLRQTCGQSWCQKAT